MNRQVIKLNNKQKNLQLNIIPLDFWGCDTAKEEAPIAEKLGGPGS